MHGHEHPHLISPKAVVARTSVSFRTIQRKVRTGEFPAPVKLGPGRIGFLETEVNDWIANLPRIGVSA